MRWRVSAHVKARQADNMKNQTDNQTATAAPEAPNISLQNIISQRICDPKTAPRAGVRLDYKTGQYVPQVDEKDVSPTSFDKERALVIARQHISQEHISPNALDPKKYPNTIAEAEAALAAYEQALQILLTKTK